MRVPLAVALVALTLVASEASAADAFALRIERSGRETAATCALVHRDDGAAGITLTFVTAGHLLRTLDTGPADVASVTVVLSPGVSLRIPPSGIILPSTGFVDVALLRATVAARDIQPVAFAPRPPVTGGAFRIAGFDSNGAPAESVQRVRIRTSALLLGDRDASALSGCEGAPAISPEGLFGVVARCEPGKVVVVSLLELADSFLRHHVPGLRSPPTSVERR